MAGNVKGKPTARGGAKKGAVKKTKPLSALYNASGDKIVRNNRFCPKCGTGTFMGKHKDRLVCGKCKYVEYTKN